MGREYVMVAGSEESVREIGGASSLPPSKYVELFGQEAPGRPAGGKGLGIWTGNPRITEAARTRAARVIRELHWQEYLDIFEMEAAHLQAIQDRAESSNQEGLPEGERG